MRPRWFLIAAGTALALGGAGFGVWNSSWLKLETVQVTGNHHATAQDVHRLLVEVQAAVLARTGILLAPEVRLIGSFEEPDLLRAGGGAGAP